MNLGKAFTFAFEDQDWLKKLGIAGLVMLIPLIGPITAGGWSLEMIRRVIRGEPETLPDWSTFGEYLVRGLKMFVIGLVYALPIILISICVSPVFFLQDNNENLVIPVIFCLSCLGGLYMIAMLFIIPAAFANFVVTDELGAAFRFSEVIGLVRAAPAAYLLALLGCILAGFIGSLGGILCAIGAAFTMAYAFVVQAHLWGQAYNEAITARGR